MLVSNYAKVLPYFFKAGVVPCFWGAKGIGKTEGFKAYCKEAGHFLSILRLGNLADGADLLGLLNFREGPDGKQVSDYAIPAFLAEVIEFATSNPDKQAVILLDEVNRLPKELEPFVFSLTLEKRIHTLQLPSNVVVAATANPPTSDYGTVRKTKDAALHSRFCHLAISTTAEDVAAFISTAHPTTNGKLMGSFLNQTGLTAEETSTGFSVQSLISSPDPRNREAVVRLLDSGLPVEFQHEVIGGMLGTSLTTKFLDFIARNFEKPILATELLDTVGKKYTQVMEKFAAQLADSANVAIVRETLEDLRTYVSGVDALAVAGLPTNKKDTEGNAILDFPPLPGRLFDVVSLVYKHLPDNAIEFLESLYKKHYDVWQSTLGHPDLYEKIIKDYATKRAASTWHIRKTVHDPMILAARAKVAAEKAAAEAQTKPTKKKK